MSKISRGNIDVNNRLSSHFHGPSAVAYHIRNHKGGPILGQNSVQLEEDLTIQEEPNSEEFITY